MRDFSKVSPTIWRSQKYRRLPSMEARHVYMYLLTCPHGNSAGCFDLPPGYASADLGITEIQYQDCLNSLVEIGLIEFDEAEHTVLIVNWLEFNAPANAKHAAGIISQLNQASSLTLKRKVFHALRADIIARKFDKDASIRNALSISDELYRDRIPTETERETEKERETRQDETRPETREVSRSALRLALAEGQGGLAPSENVSPIHSELREHARRIGAIQ